MREVLRNGMSFANEREYPLRYLYASAIIEHNFFMRSFIGLSIKERFFYVLFIFDSL